jgi:hypothetical protein
MYKLHQHWLQHVSNKQIHVLVLPIVGALPLTEEAVSIGGVGAGVI